MTEERLQYRYSLWTAHAAGEMRHPQVAILELASDADGFHPAPIGDCWLFTAREIKDLPTYVELVK